MIEPLRFTVAEIGEFQAAHRTMGTQIKIEQAYRKALGGSEEDAPESLRLIAAIQSQLEILLVVKPDGFVLDEAHINDCYSIYAELRAEEDRFRQGVEDARKGGSAAT